jgi:RND family efflux transporter MFP subunit
MGDRRKASAVIAAAALTVVLPPAGCGPGNAYVPPPPPEVTVMPPARRAVTSYATYTGTTQAIATVDLRARVKGFLKEVHFQEGADVKAGQLLLVIDEEPFQVRLAVARARLEEATATLGKAEQSKAKEVAQAQLELDQAALLLAQVEERRNRALLARNAGSREDVDKAEATRKKAEAQVSADKANLEQAKTDYQTNILAARAIVDSARSEVRNAEIDLGYCRVHAPTDGRISRKLVDVGNLVGDGEATVMATIVKDDPIYAYMSVSEADVLGFREQVRKGERLDYRKEPVRLDLGMVNEAGFPHEGRLDYVDPAIDPATGTLQARGVFPNKDHHIVPGLFVRVRVPLAQNPDALLVPDQALGADQKGSYLMLVKPTGETVVDAGGARRKVYRVESRPLHVKTGAEEAGGMRVVESVDPARPLTADDLVVVVGVQRARPELKVLTNLDAPPAKPVALSAPAGKPAAPQK